MSASLRDQRVRMFDYADASSDGRMSSSYAYVAERWGRLEAPTGREVTVAGQAEQQVDAVITLALDAPTTKDGLVKVGTQYYRVTAILPRRMANEQQVLAVFADDSTFAITGEPA